MNAAIYVRISRDRAGGGLGVSRQEADCRALATRLGWGVVAVYSDNDISAYSGKPRPGYRGLIAALEAGTVGAVLAWHTDRLHRRVVELEPLIQVCEARGAAVQTVQAGPLDLATPSGRMVARQLIVVAQYEVENGRERVRAKKAQAARAGAYRGGPRPYGYDADGVTVREDEAGHVRAAAAAVLAGRSLRAACRELNGAGARTSRGGEWLPHLLRAVLIRPRNAALIELNGATVTAQWPALLPEDEWRALVGSLTDPSRRTNAGRERRWLGSGQYGCGVCGDTMRVTMTTSGDHVYTCKASKHLTRNQPLLDDYVTRVVSARLARPDVAELLPNVEHRAEAAKLNREADVLRTRLEQGTADYADGTITGDQLKAATARITTQLSQVTNRLAALQQSSQLGHVLAARDPSAAFLAAPIEIQAYVVAALVRVTVKPAPRGRPAGWIPGTPYFDPAHVRITWV